LWAGGENTTEHSTAQDFFAHWGFFWKNSVEAVQTATQAPSTLHPIDDELGHSEKSEKCGVWIVSADHPMIRLLRS
jgi:hypothetical protein